MHCRKQTIYTADDSLKKSQDSDVSNYFIFLSVLFSPLLRLIRANQGVRRHLFLNAPVFTHPDYTPQTQWVELSNTLTLLLPCSRLTHWAKDSFLFFSQLSSFLCSLGAVQRRSWLWGIVSERTIQTFCASVLKHYNSVAGQVDQELRRWLDRSPGKQRPKVMQWKTTDAQHYEGLFYAFILIT